MPTLILPDDFLPRTTRLLLPRLSTPDEREAWLAQAFFLNDPRLYHDLRQLNGAPIVYVTRCITALLTAKCVPGRDIHSLALLLNAVRIDSAPNERREIDALVDLLDPMCGPDAPPDSQTDPALPVDPATAPVKPANPLQSIDTPEIERSPTVFISYSHRDDDFAHQLIADLQAAGHAIWVDTVSIKGGEAWVRSIADGIRNSYSFVTIISPDANGSRWVLREYLLAESLRKPIFPVIGRPADIPFQMIDRQVIDMQRDYKHGLIALISVLPTPSIPVPTVQAVADLLSVMSAPSEDSIVQIPLPAPAPSVTPPPPEPQPLPPSKGDRPDISGILDALKDAVFRNRGEEERESRPRKSDSKPDGAFVPPSRPDAPVTPPAVEVPAQEQQDEVPVANADEDAAPQMASAAPNRRALELQYLQRQWAEAFSAQQDAPAADSDAIVRWRALPSDADLEAPAGAVETGSVEQASARLWMETRAVVTGDSAQDAAETIWAAVNRLMPVALNDPSKPLPVILDLSKWTDESQPFEAFLREQLGDLKTLWNDLVSNRRAALLVSGVETLSETRKGVVEAFLRAHPELPVLVAKVG